MTAQRRTSAQVFDELEAEVIAERDARDNADAAADERAAAAPSPVSRRRCDAVLGGVATACYGRNIDIWHGYVEAALACDKHSNTALQQVFAGHRLRMSPEVAEVSES